MDRIQARIVARVRPNAGRSEVVGYAEGVLEVRVAAPPVKGKANQALIGLLSDILEVPGSSIAIEKGLTSRNKTITVTGIGQDQTTALLERHLTAR
ncbi:MAG: DUF167 domain-containing protein [Dehalococcoidia bacterium]